MKESFLIYETPNTPEISWDAKNMVLEIKGRLTVHNSKEFFNPIYDCIDDFTTLTKINLSLDYFNIFSIKSLLDFFKEVEKREGCNNKVLVQWFYEEEDNFLHEAGLDFKELVKLPFELVPIIKNYTFNSIFTPLRNEQYKMAELCEF